MRCKYFILLFLAFSLSFALASAAAPGTCVEAVITSINPSSVDANEEFTVGIEISNCGDEIPENITFEIKRFSPDISIQEPLVNDVGKLSYSNSKRFILYHMRTAQNIAPGTYTFEAELNYGRRDYSLIKKYSFGVTVKTETPELFISGVKTSPERITPKENVILTIKIENSGKGSAKSVKAILEGLNFEGVKEAYIGEIKADEELPARFVLKAGNSGDYNFNVKIDYKSSGADESVDYQNSLHVFSSTSIFYWIIPILALGCVLLVVILKTRNKKEDGY